LTIKGLYLDISDWFWLLGRSKYFPSEERVTFTGNLFEMINNLIFEILYTTQSKIHTNLYLSLINRCLQIGKPK